MVDREEWFSFVIINSDFLFLLHSPLYDLVEEIPYKGDIFLSPR